MNWEKTIEDSIRFYREQNWKEVDILQRVRNDILCSEKVPNEEKQALMGKVAGILAESAPSLPISFEGETGNEKAESLRSSSREIYLTRGNTEQVDTAIRKEIERLIPKHRGKPYFSLISRRPGSLSQVDLILERAREGRGLDGLDFDKQKKERAKEERILPRKRDRWPWRNHLASGHLNAFVGDPGTGKTTKAIFASAKISTGGDWPDGGSAQQGRVLYFSGEPKDQEGFEELVGHPTFLGDMRMIDVVWWHDEPLSFRTPTGEEKIYEIVKRAAYALIVFDPVEKFLMLKTGEEWMTSVVSVELGKLVTLASRTGACVLFTRHLNKRNGKILGAPAWEGEPSVITVTEFDSSREYSHLSKREKPRLIRPYQHKGRIGEEFEPMVWLTKRDGFIFRHPGLGYFVSVAQNAQDILTELFPPGARVPGSVLEAKRKKRRVGVRAMQEAMRVQGIMSSGYTPTREGREYYYTRRVKESK